VTGAALAIPLAAALGSSSYADQTAAAVQENASRHRVIATVLANSSAPIVISEGGGVLNDTSTVPARWALAGGAVRTGIISVPSGSHAGAALPIWVTDAGDQAPEPITHADAVTAGVLTGLFTWLGATSLLAAVFWGGRLILDRRRADYWDREWAAVADHWSVT
jgi:hypothetical protein